MLDSSWVAKQLVVSQKVLISVELVGIELEKTAIFVRNFWSLGFLNMYFDTQNESRLSHSLFPGDNV
jgi:hypothetical protein